MPIFQSMKVKLQPPSGTELAPFNPILPPAAITQVMLLANPLKVEFSLRLFFKFIHLLIHSAFIIFTERTSACFSCVSDLNANQSITLSYSCSILFYPRRYDQWHCQCKRYCVFQKANDSCWLSVLCVYVLQEKVRMRYKVTFTLGEQPLTEVGEVNDFPPAETWGAL